MTTHINRQAHNLVRRALGAWSYLHRLLHHTFRAHGWQPDSPSSVTGGGGSEAWLGGAATQGLGVRSAAEPAARAAQKRAPRQAGWLDGSRSSSTRAARSLAQLDAADTRAGHGKRDSSRDTAASMAVQPRAGLSHVQHDGGHGADVHSGHVSGHADGHAVKGTVVGSGGALHIRGAAHHSGAHAASGAHMDPPLLPHPCLHEGYTAVYTRTLDYGVAAQCTSVRLMGKPDWAACSSLARELVGSNMSLSAGGADSKSVVRCATPGAHCVLGVEQRPLKVSALAAQPDQTRPDQAVCLHPSGLLSCLTCIYLDLYASSTSPRQAPCLPDACTLCRARTLRWLVSTSCGPSLACT